MSLSLRETPLALSVGILGYPPSPSRLVSKVLVFSGLAAEFEAKVIIRQGLHSNVRIFNDLEGARRPVARHAVLDLAVTWR